VWKGRNAFRVSHENTTATSLDFRDFPICAQAQSGHSLFALVESILGG
jgi:hypothetical protein